MILTDFFLQFKMDSALFNAVDKSVKELYNQSKPLHHLPSARLRQYSPGVTPSGPSDLAKSSPAEYELVPFLHLSRRRPRSCKKCLGRLSLYREWTKVLHMHMIHIVCLTCITFFPECQELSWRQEEGLESTTV